MAYILVANPAILAAAGVPVGPAVAATAAAAALSSILMGVVADFPIALASGMGLNAVIAYQIAPATGSWQTAMGLVVLDGLLVLALVLVGLREAVMRAIPHALRVAIGVGIGLFIAFIGAVNAKLVVVPGGTLVALVGTCLTAALVVRRVTGAIVIGILGSTAVAVALGLVARPAGGWVALPSFATVGQVDLRGALAPAALALLLPIMLVDFFDTI